MGSRGPWKKLREIGRGSFGLVYLVQRDGDPRKYVMKEVNLRGLPKTEMIAAQNEVAVLKKIKHPHAVAIEAALVVDDTLCIVMEWAEGKDLDTLIRQRKQENRPFSEAEVLKIFWQLTSVLAHCHHDLHMLHRDLKPQNVFLAANGDVKLGDFGLAKVIEATCALVKTQCGTPVYMSPELCNGQDYNRGADVWALGCILYELMTLTMPWADVAYNAAGGMSALLKRIANSQLDLTPCKKRYSLELCNLLASMLHKQPRNRPALKQVLQLDIVSRAAPKPAAPAEKPLPPNWRKVPSASRPGEFSYQHVPTGYKQAAFPERDELPAEVQAALAKATFSPGHRPPLGTPNQATPRGQGTPAARPTPHDEASRALKEQISSALPPSWRKVPSASRPGEFSYLHVPTGFKQAEVPTSDAPPPAAFAAWSKANAANGRPPPTAMGGAGGAPGAGARPRLGGAPGNFGRLEPVSEHRSNQAQAAFGAAPPPNKGRPPSAPRALGPHGQANQQPQHVGQRPRY